MPFVLMWGITGVYLAVPEWFQATVDYFDPFDPSILSIDLVTACSIGSPTYTLAASEAEGFLAAVVPSAMR